MLVIGKLVLKMLFYEKERQIYQDLVQTRNPVQTDTHVTEKNKTNTNHREQTKVNNR